jgi:hypothetical protein
MGYGLWTMDNALWVWGMGYGLRYRAISYWLVAIDVLLLPDSIWLVSMMRVRLCLANSQ